MLHALVAGNTDAKELAQLAKGQLRNIRPRPMSTLSLLNSDAATYSSNRAGPVYGHQYSQAVFQGEFHSTPSPNNQVFLPSGVKVSGVDEWLGKLQMAA